MVRASVRGLVEDHYKKIAILSDIHANIHALRAVWEDLRASGVQKIYHLGDLVGYNANPSEVIEFIREKEIPGLVGNYDMAVVSDVPDPVETYLNSSISPIGMVAYQWTREQLSVRDRDYLLSRPERMDLTWEGHRLTLVHGSPDNIREYLKPDTPLERFEKLVSETGAEIMLFGHTHLPLLLRMEKGTAINPGSVGKPKDGDPRASYLILRLKGDHIIPEIRRVAYPVESAAETVRLAGLPDSMADSLLKGQSA